MMCIRYPKLLPIPEPANRRVVEVEGGSVGVFGRRAEGGASSGER